MLSKILAAKANFKHIGYLSSFKAEDDSKTNFIINPKEDDVELKVNEYNIDIEEVQGYSQENKRKKQFSSMMSNSIIFNNESGNMMNYEMNQLSNTKVNEEKTQKEVRKKKCK